MNRKGSRRQANKAPFLTPWAKGRKLGDKWVLVENVKGVSHVWYVRADETSAVAKRPRSQNPSSTELVRFYNEVKGLESLGATCGVVPLLEREEGDEPRWFIMQKAEPLAEHVKDKSFRYLMGIFADLAGTLDRLQKQEGVSHRDIKPDNLFWLERTPAFGDFGIAGWKDRVSKTQELNKLGPFAYLAPEALRVSNEPMWHAADVYSLTKTIWALAEYQFNFQEAANTDDGKVAQILYPPQGEMNATKQWSYSFRRFFGSEGRYLDPVLQDATSNEPAQRPTARDLRDEIRAWLRLVENVEPKPSPLSVYGTLVNSNRRFVEARELFLDTLRHEVSTQFGEVIFDSSVNTEWLLDLESSEYGASAILASHGRDVAVDPGYDGPPPDNPWEGAVVLQLVSSSGRTRVIIGGVLEGTADRPTIDLLAELHHPDSAGEWKFIDKWDERYLNARGAAVVDTLRDTLRKVVEVDGTEDVQWRSSRVL